NISIDRSRHLVTPAKYQEEIANYSDDWESDYSDDWISDCADDWEPASKTASKLTKVPMQQLSKSGLKTDLEEISKQTRVLKHQELRNEIKTDPKEATRIPNITIQKESSSDLNIDLKEPVTPKNVREQSQLETNISNDNIHLVLSDPNAFTSVFCQQRQAAIDNMAYRTAVNSWKAK
ncbi:unnamed protein product, partial [Rotaria sp. Silwood1]